MHIYTTRRIVAALMHRFDIETKYGLAKLIGVSHKTVRSWVDEGRTMDESNAQKAAELLGLDYEFLLICIQMERANKNPELARAWSKVASLWDSSKVAAFGLLFCPLINHFSSLPGVIS